jgi:hypothetical protein
LPSSLQSIPGIAELRRLVAKLVPPLVARPPDAIEWPDVP